VTTQIVDAHHHIWRTGWTPWLSGPMTPRIFGPYHALRRDYLAAEYAADARPSGVTRSVHIQANVAPGKAVDEVAWATSSGRQAGLVQAVVAFADLTAADVGDLLDRELAYPAVRGIRQQLHWHRNPAWRYAPVPDLMLDPRWQRGLREVTRRGLHFELQVFPDQYVHALRLVEAFSDTTFVLLHAGMPADRTLDGMTFWRQGLARFAVCPNVLVKLSGLGTFTRRCRLDEWQPVIETAIDLFGPGRCMFGSNFPIEKLWTDYATLTSVFRASLSRYTPGEQQQVLHDVAVRIYQPGTSQPVPATRDRSKRHQ
jgi:predicted TIM-barrel fold metal-dependent hydrolase